MNVILRDNFRRKLREAMQDRGMTQKALEAASGVLQSEISQYMNGKIQPGVDKVEAFAVALGVSPWNLLDDQPLKYLPTPPPEPETAKRSKPVAPARARASTSK